MPAVPRLGTPTPKVRSDPVILAIGSGKGGVGKTTLVANLAIALQIQHKVGVVDGDLSAPNLARLFNIERQTPADQIVLAQSPSTRTLIPSVERHGVEIASPAFLLGEGQALSLMDQTVSLLWRRLLLDVHWNQPDVLLIDLPPGIGAPVTELLRVAKVDGAIVIVTPDELSHVDALRFLEFLDTRRVPILGCIENMVDFVCPNCSHPIRLARSCPEGQAVWNRGTIRRLGRVPLDPGVHGPDERRMPFLLANPSGPASAAVSQIALEVSSFIRSTLDERG